MVTTYKQFTVTAQGGGANNPDFPWLDTGIDIEIGEHLSITTQGAIHLYPPKLDGNMPWVDANGCVDNIMDCDVLFQDALLIPYARAGMLIGRIGTEGTLFQIGASYDSIASEIGRLYLATNGYIHLNGPPWEFAKNEWYTDNRGSFTSLIIKGAPAEPAHDQICTGQAFSKNPIDLHNGDKIVSAVDISVQTPVGELALKRSYRQIMQSISENDNRYRWMGLGWSHNHDVRLFLTGTTSERDAEVFLDGWQRLKLKEDSNQTGHFDALAGSFAVLDHDLNSNEYILTMDDHSTYVFDSTSPYRLKQRNWSNGEQWTYAYYSSPNIAEGKLQSVDDGYGRGLQFIYINNPSNTDHLHLWRVGDQDSAGLDNTSPTGRYIEYTYLESHKDGVPVTPNPELNLVGVRDIRGHLWTYQYYGQVIGEDDSDQLNFLTQRLSPLVDTTGDGDADTTLILEALTYTIDGSTVQTIRQERGNGLLITDFAFQPDGANVTREASAEHVIVHEFAHGVYVGARNMAGDISPVIVNDDYRTESHINGNGQITRLTWNGKLLDQVRDAIGHETMFAYDNQERLTSSTDADGRLTEYLYTDNNNPRLPTVIKVWDTDEISLLRYQTWDYDSQGRTLETRAVDPTDEITILQKIIHAYYLSGDGAGLLESMTEVDLVDASNNQSTIYTYDSVGRVIKTQNTSLLGSCQVGFTVYDMAGNVVASICNYDAGLNPDPTTAEQAIALYNPDEPDKNHVTIYCYDQIGRQVSVTTDAGADFATTTLTLYDALDRVWRVITHYINSDSYTSPATWTWNADTLYWQDGEEVTIGHGSQNTKNIINDTFYNQRGLIRAQRDTLGNLTLFGYDQADRLVKTVQNASDFNYDNDYTGDPSLGDYQADDRADQDIVTEQSYDSNGNLIRSVDPLGQITYTIYDALNRPIKVVRAAKDSAVIGLSIPGDADYIAENDPRSDDYLPSPEPDRDLIEITDYDAMGRVVRTCRLVDVRPLQRWETTLYGHDALGRRVRVVRYASDPDYDMTLDPDLSAYPISPNLDQDILSTTVYDSYGRVLYTQDVDGECNWQSYDGLGRVVKIIGNAVGTATDGGINDPRSNSYVPSTNPDQDIITLTFYNTDGRIERTQDVSGRWTLYGYDLVGRQVRIVRNASEPDYFTTANPPDPELIYYVPISDADQDLLTETVYDGQGRVLETINPHGNVTRQVYDEAGRGIRTIVNYVPQGISDPVDWIWDDGWQDGYDNPIEHGIENDQNLITLTTYDRAGRVVRVREVTGIETRHVYDLAGRRVWMIQNYLDGVFDPDFPDEDVIEQMVYNQAGQLMFTTDPRGTLTAFKYDVAGRRVMVVHAYGTSLVTVDYTCYDKVGQVLRTIQNWIDNDVSPDAQDINGNWEFGSSMHGDQADENLMIEYVYDFAGRRIQIIDAVENITATTYFKNGQVNYYTDAEGVLTAFRYDRLSRRVLVVQGFVSQAQDPAYWNWDNGWQDGNNNPIPHGIDNDQNIIVEATYDKGGRRLTLRDPRGNLTQYAYDLLDRRIKLTNPLADEWITTYEDLSSGRTRATMTYPGLRIGGDYDVEREFDRSGRLRHVSYGDLTSTPDVTFGYNVAGDRVMMTEYSGVGFTDPIRATSYDYDGMRRLTRVDFDTETVRYEYDGGGLRTKLRLGGNLNVIYTYDALGQLTGITDWDDQVSILGYDAVGRHRITERDNDFHSTYIYDEVGRLLEIKHQDMSSVPVTLGEFAYLVDGRGNRTQAIERVRQPDDSYDERTWVYSYDNVSRLLSATVHDGLTTGDPVVREYGYAYDVAGNRTWETIDTATTHYMYNAANQITSDGVNNFTYDANGNLTTGYTWDRANRLLSTGGHHYAYDGDGNRISQTVSSIVTQYLLDVQPGLVKLLRDDNGTTVNHYIHAPRGIHAQSDGTSWQYLAQDGLGSVRSMISDTLNVDAIQSYDPYGNPESSYGVGFGFTGEMTDENGQVYLRARYYNPVLGIFPSRDPFEGLMDRPMSLNGYSWVEGNPINNVDPSGIATVDIWASAFIAPDFITFPYVNFTDFDNLNAKWEGDNRSFYTGGPSPTARVWFNIRFDWNDLSTVSSKAGTNPTKVWYRPWSRMGQLTMHKDQAPFPDDPFVSCISMSDATRPGRWIHGVEVEIETTGDSGKNPLVPSAPPIELAYDILILPSLGEIKVTRKIDRFPWHELYIAIDDSPVVAWYQIPTGPAYSPVDLFLPAYTDQITWLFSPVQDYQGCVPHGATAVSLLPIDLDCAFM